MSRVFATIWLSLMAVSGVTSSAAVAVAGSMMSSVASQSDISFEPCVAGTKLPPLVRDAVRDLLRQPGPHGRIVDFQSRNMQSGVCASAIPFVLDDGGIQLLLTFDYQNVRMRDVERALHFLYIYHPGRDGQVREILGWAVSDGLVKLVNNTALRAAGSLVGGVDVLTIARATRDFQIGGGDPSSLSAYPVMELPDRASVYLVTWFPEPELLMKSGAQSAQALIITVGRMTGSVAIGSAGGFQRDLMPSLEGSVGSDGVKVPTKTATMTP